MKKSAFIFIMTLLVQSTGVCAEDEPRVWNPYEIEKEQIAWAIKVLAYSKIIKPDENKCAQFDSDIINELVKDGLLKVEMSKLMTVCLGSVK